MTMSKRLERFGEVRIVDKRNEFGLDSLEKKKSGVWSTSSDVGAIL